ncbi:MAG: hypothetical protein AAFO95_06185 [Cyanobacteria bacterium J06600_6]
MTTSKTQTQTAADKVTPRIINVTESIPDITANLVVDSEHYQLPSYLFEGVLFEALNDLIDRFAQNPNQYLEPHHYQKIDRIAEEYLQS